jgi:pimeloyl-ACP methyl ester carboxylesterase
MPRPLEGHVFASIIPVMASPAATSPAGPSPVGLPRRRRPFRRVPAAPASSSARAWAARRQITAEGCCFEPSRYGPEPYLYTLALIEDGRRHLLLQQGLDLPCPLRILQGDQDPDVSYDHALRTFHALRGDDIRLTLIKGGDHRLSTPRDIALLLATIDELAQASDEERQ